MCESMKAIVGTFYTKRRKEERRLFKLLGILMYIGVKVEELYSIVGD